MAVGWPSDKTAINTKAGQLVFDVREALDRIGEFKSRFLDTTTDQQFTDRGLSGADITLLRAAFTDLDALRQIAYAQRQQVGNNDFFWNARQLTGVE